jgi:hypothetical protein
VEPLDGGRLRFSYDFTYPRGGDDVPGRMLTTTTRSSSARGQLTNTTVYEKKDGPGQPALQGAGFHLEPSGSFLKCELVTKS